MSGSIAIRRFEVQGDNPCLVSEHVRRRILGGGCFHGESAQNKGSSREIECRRGRAAAHQGIPRVPGEDAESRQRQWRSPNAGAAVRSEERRARLGSERANGQAAKRIGPVRCPCRKKYESPDDYPEQCWSLHVPGISGAVQPG